MPNLGRAIRQQQLRWAEASGLAIGSAGYTRTLDDNLFVTLSPEAQAEFAAGDGCELGDHGARGKMQALHSSSALACNVFDYWRERDRTPLAASLQCCAEIVSIQFERKFPTGLRGNAPNLDVVLGLAGGSVLAIESKFTEPYGAHAAPGFKPKYFNGPGLWAEHGLPKCQAVAELIQSGDLGYRWLHAEQLLKHVLGLAHSGERWQLMYLWYQPDGPEGLEHQAEVDDFAARVAGDDDIFRSLTYQQVFGALRRHCGTNDSNYVAYLESRYSAGRTNNGFDAENSRPSS